jgi:hypothetical protein
MKKYLPHLGRHHDEQVSQPMIRSYRRHQLNAFSLFKIKYAIHFTVQSDFYI